jgi:hypothetical protein
MLLMMARIMATVGYAKMPTLLGKGMENFHLPFQCDCDQERLVCTFSFPNIVTWYTSSNFYVEY